MAAAAPRRGVRARLRALRERSTWVWLHRWVGLVMALFLVIAGVTGSLLAFYDELDAGLNPQLHVALPPHPGAPMLDAVTLRDHALAARPGMHIDSAVTPWREGRTLVVHMEGAPGTQADDELFLDPYTGAAHGSRRWGDLSQGRVNVMPFLYQLHSSLALGVVGTYVFGLVALLWTLDCFVGAYLTLPRGRPLLPKWRPAWQVQRKRLNFDLHRAGGLWTWALLFVLAWSSVALNLGEVYRPVTQALLGFHVPPTLPARDEKAEPGLSWREAHARGQVLMREALAQLGIGPHREDALRHDEHRGEFNYWVATSFKNGGEPADWFGVSFDADTGALLRVNEEHGRHERAGDFVTRWLLDLHMAKVGGQPWRIAVCVMGGVVTVLSVTGVVVWWRKRRGRRATARPFDKPRANGRRS